MKNPDFLFVYGTLRQGASHEMFHILAEHCEFFSEGWARGTLYDLGEYPGIVLYADSPGFVKGEIYRILDEKAVLPPLDDYEECSDRFPVPREYVREIHEVYADGGETVRAWIYRFNHDVSNLKIIDSGDYLEK